MGKKSIAALILAGLLAVSSYFLEGKSIDEAMKIAFGTQAEKVEYCAKVLAGE